MHMLPRSLLIVFALLTLPVTAAPIEFRVLTYNVFLRAPTWMFHNQHTWRAERIPPYLVGYDAVVLQEAFSYKHRQMILDALRDEYPYHSRILGEDEFMSYNGGVIIVSRWPIATQDQVEFDVCDGSDCMVKKGVVYTAIDKPGLPVNLFGLHLQAEKKYSPARVRQFPQIRRFIEKQNIASDEPVIVAGDFNVDYFSNALDNEF
jgi:endonuclease/exonuclease/phosphatase family metal-dependent hydrolase